ncbi:MAG: hypothetical protein ACP5NY_07850 [Thermocladium sp.]
MRRIAFSRWIILVDLLAAAVLLVASLAQFQGSMGKPLISLSSNQSPQSGSIKALSELAIPIYVMGSQSFITSIDAVLPGIKPASLGYISGVPNRSAVIVDWGYLVVRMGGNTSMAVHYLETLVRRGSFVAVRAGNASWALALEYALTTEWASMNGAPTVVPTSPASQGDYVVIAPLGQRALLVSLANQRETIAKLYAWSASIEYAEAKHGGVLSLFSLPGISNFQGAGSYDECVYEAKEYGAPSGSTVGITDGYFYWTGPYYYQDNEDDVVGVDFCILVNTTWSYFSINGIRYPNLWGDAWTSLYADPSSGVAIGIMSSYQDFYSSYMYNQGTIEPDVSTCSINGVNFVGWALSNTIAPGGSRGTESYTIGITSGSSLIFDYTVSLPTPASIGIYGNPGSAAGGAIDYNWLLQPTISDSEATYLDTSTLDTLIVGPANAWAPQTPAEINVPVGTSASLLTPWCPQEGETVVYDLEWIIFYPSPPSGYLAYYQLINAYPSGPSQGTGGFNVYCADNAA